MWTFQSPIIHVGRDDSYTVGGEIKDCEIVEKTSDLYYITKALAISMKTADGHYHVF